MNEKLILIVNDCMYTYNELDKIFDLDTHNIIISFQSHTEKGLLNYQINENFLYDVESGHSSILLVDYNLLTRTELTECCRNPDNGLVGDGHWPSSIYVTPEDEYHDFTEDDEDSDRDEHDEWLKRELIRVSFRVQQKLDEKAGKIDSSILKLSNLIR